MQQHKQNKLSGMLVLGLNADFCIHLDLEGALAFKVLVFFSGTLDHVPPVFVCLGGVVFHES